MSESDKFRQRRAEVTSEGDLQNAAGLDRMEQIDSGADTEFALRLEAVRHRIIDAGGDLDKVKILAVTKTLPVSEVQRALRHGLHEVGENYAQELVAKSSEIQVEGLMSDDLGAPRWNLIGNVQRNKVRKLADIVSLWQTVDRLSLGQEIAKRAPAARVLVQVNTTKEDSKAGVGVDSAAELVSQLSDLGLLVEGLMTIGPTDRSTDPSWAFQELRKLAETLGLRELSMGMSGDIEKAVAEGSTMIRVGTALFGARDRAN